MIYVTGDIHGDYERWYKPEYQINSLDTSDILIVCGDFGHEYYGDKEENEILDELEEKGFMILWCDGNHENFELLEEFPIEIWNGGKVHRIRKNILHLMRGQVFEIVGNIIFVMGGGYSRDKHLRKEHESWWKQEMPSEEEYMEACNNLKKHDYCVDYIISHAAPETIMDMYYPKHDGEKQLNIFLEWVVTVVDAMQLKHHYFGHIHRDKDISKKQTVLHYDVRKLVGNEKVVDKYNKK